MQFSQICKAIKEVKIQGSGAVAKAGVKALLLRHDKKAIRKLISLRPTEPCLRNAIHYALMFSPIDGGVKQVFSYFDSVGEKIREIGSKRIHDGMTIFTHCHSTSVISILKEAKKQGKRFTVYNTETRPLYQGRITAKELSKAGIKVIHIIDSAARLALKKADLFLFGADAITADGNIINKIGTGLYAEMADKLDVPCYSCTVAWKFDPLTLWGEEEEIEQRPAREVWPRKPKGVRILNPAFAVVRENQVDGIISELGILTVSDFIQQTRRTYPFMFEK